MLHTIKGSTEANLANLPVIGHHQNMRQYSSRAVSVEWWRLWPDCIVVVCLQIANKLLGHYFLDQLRNKRQDGHRPLVRSSSDLVAPRRPSAAFFSRGVTNCHLSAVLIRYISQ